MEKEEKYTKQEKANEESFKLGYDFFKHITTLSTGTLLFLITFIEKIFQNPSWKFLVSVCFVSLVISIISSLITMFFTTQIVADFGELERNETKIAQWSFFICLGFFVLGVFSFVLFALINFNK